MVEAGPSSLTVNAIGLKGSRSEVGQGSKMSSVKVSVSVEGLPASMSPVSTTSI